MVKKSSASRLTARQFYQRQVQQVALSEFSQQILNETLWEPVDEFLSRPRKGVRADLVRLGFDLFGNTSTDRIHAVEQLGQVIEIIHDGSLIVDDIQDNSPVRRNGPSLHQTCGLARALNAGNWLYFWSFKKLKDIELPNHNKVIISELLQDMLFDGHLGQALDLAAPVDKMPVGEISSLCLSTMGLKTGSLTGVALACGAAAATDDADSIANIKKIGHEFGIILQMFDDLKNLKLPENQLAMDRNDKRLEDLINRRPSFVWALAAECGVESAVEDLVAAMETLPDLALLRTWTNQYGIHKLGRSILDKREKQLNEELQQFLLKLNIPVERAKSFSKLIERLEKAYENE